MDEILGVSSYDVRAGAAPMAPVAQPSTRDRLQSHDPDDNSAAVDAFAESADEIAGVIGSRRVNLSSHEATETARSALCDKVRALKAGQFPTLEKRIKSLEYTDKEMYEYIRCLERIQYAVVSNS